MPDKAKDLIAHVEIRNGYAGLGQMVAFRAIEKKGWPKGIEAKFHRFIYGACAAKCNDWVHASYVRGKYTTSLTDLDADDPLLRVARIAPVWYGSFAAAVEKMIVAQPETRRPSLAQAGLRHVLEDPDDRSNDLFRPQGRTVEIPILSNKLKDAFNLRRFEKRKLLGKEIAVETTDGAKIINRLTSARRRVQLDEAEKEAFWIEIGFKPPPFDPTMDKDVRAEQLRPFKPPLLTLLENGFCRKLDELDPSFAPPKRPPTGAGEFASTRT